MAAFLSSTGSAPGEPFRLTDKGLLLRVKVLAGAGRSEVAGLRSGELAVRVQAPALEGRANRELRRFLAGRLGLPASRVEILSGESSPHKRLRLPADALGALRDLLDS